MNNFNLHLKECEWRWIHSPPAKNQSKKEIKRYLLDLEKDLCKALKEYIKFVKMIKKFENLNS